jgi:chorismate mutase
MTEQQDRLALEREEVARRVANFKATQEKFKREREKYFVTTLENARHELSARRIDSGARPDASRKPRFRLTPFLVG